MTPLTNPWQSYRKITTETAAPEQLVMMLYDGAVNYLEKSLTGFEHQDPAERIQTISNNVIRAQSIIFELNSRLDMEKGAEVAENFRRLYDYFYRRLQEANIKKRKGPIEEVARHLRGIRDTWSEMLHRVHSAEPADSAAPEDGYRLA
jgi:flagellar protein FliS